jgi:hypothetical protein
MNRVFFATRVALLGSGLFLLSKLFLVVNWLGKSHYYDVWFLIPKFLFSIAIFLFFSNLLLIQKQTKQDL